MAKDVRCNGFFDSNEQQQGACFFLHSLKWLEEENEKMTEYEFFKMIGGGKRKNDWIWIL